MDIKMKPLLETLQLLDISDEEYFSSKYSNYISNSKLKYMNPEQGGSPSIFKEGIPFTASPSLVLGSAVHCITLQPNDFVLAPLTTKPTAKLGIMADELYKTFENTCDITDEDVIQASDKVDYYKGKLTADRIAEVKNKCRPYLEGRLDWITRTNDTREPIFLDSKMWEIATACINSINKDKEIQSLLNPESFDAYVLNEGTLLMDVEANVDGMTTILKLKAKLDSFTIDVARNRIILNDLKTTGHLVRDFGNSFKFYHYSRQGAMYLWLLKLYAEQVYKLQHPEMYVNFMLVSTVPNYQTGVYRCRNHEIAEGFKEFKRLLRMVAYCEIYGYDGSMGTNIDGSQFDL